MLRVAMVVAVAVGWICCEWRWWWPWAAAVSMLVVGCVRYTVQFLFFVFLFLLIEVMAFAVNTLERTVNALGLTVKTEFAVHDDKFAAVSVLALSGFPLADSMSEY